MQAFKDPSLKLRYARGLGDIIACILHSKAIGWLTKLITGKDKPCTVCSVRQQALNLLAPLPLWKMFFKNTEEASQAYADEYIKAGHKAQSLKIDNGYQIMSAEVSQVPEKKGLHQPSEQKYESILIDSKLVNYNLVSMSESEHDHILIRTHVYKKK